MLEIFKDPEAAPAEIAEVGEKLLLKLHGGNIERDNPDDLWFCIFTTFVVKPKYQLARLAPTRNAAKNHSFRTYQQV